MNKIDIIAGIITLIVGLIFMGSVFTTGNPIGIIGIIAIAAGIMVIGIGIRGES